MTNLSYIVRMEGGDTFGTFLFCHHAERFAKGESRRNPEVRYVLERDYGSGIMVSCTSYYQAGRKVRP